MSFTAGIIGLPNAGKTTLFNALTAAGAEASAYPFCTIEPNVATVPVMDNRLRTVVELSQTQQWAAATVKFMDVAGLVRGAAQGEGLGNQFLAHIRNVDVLVHVVRCFENEQVAHVEGSLNPRTDIETINTELLLADLETLGKIKIKIKKMIRGGDRTLEETVKLLERVEMALDQNQPAYSVPLLSAEEKIIFDEFELLSAKKVIYVANIAEKDLAQPGLLARQVEDVAEQQNAECLALCGELEASLADLDPDEQLLFREEYNLTTSGLERLVAAVVAQLKLVVFYTIVGREARSWLIPQGTPAPQAAGKIHTDIARGFIKAEVLTFDHFRETKSWATAREQGLLRIEGKKYIIQDGDVVLFRFNV